MNKTSVTRFAPSPTGYLHTGHAFSFFTVMAEAEKMNAHVLLRIEDIDHTRCRADFREAIFEDLTWLGWEGAGKKDTPPVRLQSDHLGFYQAQMQALIAQDLVYRCFKTRRQIAAACSSTMTGPDGPVYYGAPLSSQEEQERLARGEAFAWRLSSRAVKERFSRQLQSLSFWEDNAGPEGQSGRVSVDPDRFGDVILARKDIGTSYHLSCVLDDALQGVTHIIRGQDLFHATSVHRVLQMLFALPEPRYYHHRLLTDAEGKKFSKSDGAPVLRDLRAAGLTAEKLRQQLGF